MAKLFSFGTIVAISLLLAGCYTDFGPVVTDSVPPNAQPFSP